MGGRETKIGTERSKFDDNVLFKATGVWRSILLRELAKRHFQKERKLSQ